MNSKILGISIFIVACATITSAAFRFSSAPDCRKFVFAPSCRGVASKREPDDKLFNQSVGSLIATVQRWGAKAVKGAAAAAAGGAIAGAGGGAAASEYKKERVIRGFITQKVVRILKLLMGIKGTDRNQHGKPLLRFAVRALLS